MSVQSDRHQLLGSHKEDNIMEKNLRIVMVDDNTDYLFTMETFLKRNGFEVQTSDDGRKGLELIGKETIGNLYQDPEDAKRIKKMMIEPDHGGAGAPGSR